MCETHQSEEFSCCCGVTDSSGTRGNVWMALLSQRILYVNVGVQILTFDGKPRVMHVLAAYYKTRLTTFSAL